MTPVATEKKAKAAAAPKNDKQSLLEEMAGKMSGLYGEDDYAHDATKDVIPSGSLSLDMALGVGGYPRGSILDVYGPESAGKSLLSILLMSQLQKQNGTIVVWDAERSYSKNLSWMRINGVDTSKIIFMKLKPDEGAEAGFDKIIELVKADAVDLVVIDSVPSLIPQAALERTLVEEAILGRRASMMTNAIGRLVSVVDDSKSIVMCINQMRCLEKNTLVMTRRGLLKVEDLISGDRIPLPGGDKTVIATNDSGVIDGVSIRTKYAGSLIISNNHQQPVIRGGELKTVFGRDVRVGDFLASPIGAPEFWGKKVPYVKTGDNGKIVIDEKMAFFMGLYCADGCIVSTRGYKRVSFTERDADRHSIVTKASVDVFGDAVCSRRWAVDISKGNAAGTVLKSGCQIGGANKRIPSAIMRSRFSIVREFLRGAMLDTHGFSKSGFIFTSDSSEYAHQIGILLSSIGINADIRVPSTSGNIPQVHISGIDAITFRDLIGFVERKKSAAAKLFSYSVGARGKYDVVPHAFGVKIMQLVKSAYAEGSMVPVGASVRSTRITDVDDYGALSACRSGELNFSRDRLLSTMSAAGLRGTSAYELMNNNRFFPVTSVEKTMLHGIDIQVDGDELFKAGRFLTHNSNIDANNRYAPKEKETSHWALKHWATLRMQVNKMGKPNEENGVPVSHRVRVKIIKNKVASPYRQAEFDINYTRGIEIEREVADIMVGAGLITQKGAWYFMGEEKFQGLDNVVAKFRAEPKLLEDAKKKVLALGSELNAFGLRNENPLASSSTGGDDLEITAE